MAITKTQILIKKALSKLSEDPNYHRRQSQIQFMHTWDGMLSSNDNGKPNVLLAELPTGSGKSLGALLPALAKLQALRDNGDDKTKIVYSTSTVNLMQQVMEHDIPKVQAAGFNQFKYLSVVGRGRYICTRSAENTVIEQGQHSLFGEQAVTPTDITVIEEILHDYNDSRWSGIRDDLAKSKQVSDHAWSQIKANSNTCSKNCPYYNEGCAFIEARKEISSADVIIANHSMVFADLETNAILPELDHQILIMDEGDQAFENFRSTQQHSLFLQGLYNITKVHAPVSKDIHALGYELKIDNKPSEQKVESTLMAFKDELDNVINFIQHQYTEHQSHLSHTEKQKNIWDVTLPHYQHSDIEQALQALYKPIATLCVWIEGIKDRARTIEINATQEQTLMSLSVVYESLSSANDTLTMLMRHAILKPLAIWIKSTGDKRTQYSINVCRVDVSEPMKTSLWSQIKHCVVMSATLRSLSSFAHLYTKLGLIPSKTIEQALPSPFDYSKSSLHLFPNFPEPNWKDEREHTAAINAEVIEFMKYHKAGMILFSSKRQMDAYVALLPEWLQDISLVQYSMSRDALIKEHKKRIDAHKQSLIIGVSSMSVGVDLPRQYLTFLAIAKITFGDHSDPISSAEHQDCIDKGGNPFMDISLTNASGRLVQAVGRLIRSNECIGTVAIFDPRMITKRYGQTLLNALPAFEYRYHQHAVAVNQA